MEGLYSDSAAFERFLERFVDMGFETQSQCVDIMHFYRSIAYLHERNIYGASLSTPATVFPRLSPGSFKSYLAHPGFISFRQCACPFQSIARTGCLQ